MDDPNMWGNGKKNPEAKGSVPGVITMSQSAHDIKFADFAQVVLTPTHGIIKFGLHQAGTNEFVVHTQVALPPQAIVRLAEGMKLQIDKIRDQHKQQGHGQTPSPMEE